MDIIENEASSGKTPQKMLFWSKSGLLETAFHIGGPFETFEDLAFDPIVKTAVQKLALGFLGAEDLCNSMKLPWRRGAFLFGPGGSGKTAATRGIALLLEKTHITIPSHEILDTQHLMRALDDISKFLPCVVVFENIDRIFKRLGPDDFFECFDRVAERTSGVIWIATSKRPEDVPKTQVVRPGRFDESIRFGFLTDELKVKYYETYLEPLLEPGPLRNTHLELLSQNKFLSFAQLLEMRHLVSQVMMDGETDRLSQAFESYCKEQVIQGDRNGSGSPLEQDVEARVRLTDPKLLLSALDVTGAMKRIVETTVTAAVEAGALNDQNK